MAPATCQSCHTARAQVLRPKNRARVCAPCFVRMFEDEVAAQVEANGLFRGGEKVAIGASGGKDSTVLAAVLTTLNRRRRWGLDLLLLSVDEGIAGYRDHSLDAVRRHAAQYALPLTVVSYAQLYGWSMDQVVAQTGTKANCTYCGVFRRQALDRGAAMLGVAHVVTGHNADDVAETVLMNLLRGDLPRLGRAATIVTGAAPPPRAPPAHPAAVTPTAVKRSKPLMYAYEKEIVLYAHHRKLDYFSTECVYSPEAFRGSARTLVKSLERIRPESILDVVRSGVDMAKLVPDAARHHGQDPGGADDDDDDAAAGDCGAARGQSRGGEMADMEQQLRHEQRAAAHHAETEVTLLPGKAASVGTEPGHPVEPGTTALAIRTRHDKAGAPRKTPAAAPTQRKLGQCERCGYLSSQAVCKACVLLEGLNKARPRTEIAVRDSAG